MGCAETRWKSGSTGFSTVAWSVELPGVAVRATPPMTAAMIAGVRDAQAG